MTNLTITKKVFKWLIGFMIGYNIMRLLCGRGDLFADGLGSVSDIVLAVAIWRWGFVKRGLKLITVCIIAEIVFFAVNMYEFSIYSGILYNLAYVIVLISLWKQNYKFKKEKSND